MNLFALSGLMAGIAGTVMAGLVYFASRAARISRLWAMFCLAVSAWGFGGLLIGLTANAKEALIWWRIAHVGVILIPVCFYHFIITFTETRHPKTLMAAYAASAAFLVADATPFFISGVRPVFGEFYYDAPPGILYVLFVLCFVGMVIASEVELWRFLRRGIQRTHVLLARWLLIGTSIGFAGGATCFLPVFGIDLYPYGNFAVTLFPLIMAYAFLRYRLVDVNLAVARSLTFLATYAVVAGLPFYAGFRYQSMWRAALAEWWWVGPMVLMGLLSSASPVIFLSVVRRMERKLSQAQRRYHRTLVAASSGMTRVKEIQHLCRLITHMVSGTVGLTNGCLFLYEPKGQRYVLRSVRYPSLIPADQAVDQLDPLISLLQEEKDLVVLEELEQEMEARRAPSIRRRLGGSREAQDAAVRDRPAGLHDPAQQAASVYAWMRKLEARLIVPSFSNDRLLAFLVLGAKRSGEAYTTDDIALFSALANQAALAIENAMFFEQLRDNEAYMIQSEKLASLGQLASGMAHEIHNPLTIISGESQLYLERFRGKDPEVDEVLKSIVEECQRAADITRRILRFAKPAPTDFVPVNLKTIIEETLTLAGYQVRLDRFECTVSVPENLPKVRGNQNQLQEVLLNLVLNACQAMGEKGGKLALVAAAENSHVALKVEDNGPGIPTSTLRKVFDPFYTTKPTGTGLGLFVTQRIVKSHGGTIELESAEGKGTCFTIRLPAWKEDQVGVSH